MMVRWTLTMILSDVRLVLRDILLPLHWNVICLNSLKGILGSYPLRYENKNVLLIHHELILFADIIFRKQNYFDYIQGRQKMVIIDMLGSTRSSDIRNRSICQYTSDKNILTSFYFLTFIIFVPHVVILFNILNVTACTPIVKG